LEENYYTVINKPNFQSNISVLLVKMISLAIIAALASCVPTVLTAPTLDTRQDVKEVSINIQFIKATSEIDLSVTDKATSKSLGYACSGTLNADAFANFPISADIDENGAGNLTIGPDTYVIHEDSKYSGGITCIRMFNHLETLVRCNAAVPASIEATSSTTNVPSCFSDSNPSLHRSAASLSHGISAPGVTERTTRREGLPVDKRQTCTWYEVTNRVGDGDPHQNYLDKQLSVSSS